MRYDYQEPYPVCRRSTQILFLGEFEKPKPDVYLRSLIYTLGICHDTRRNFNSIYDSSKREIIPEAIYKPWQTGSSLKVTRLAFQLFTDSTPTAFIDDIHNIDECQCYSVSDIFCCSYAPYFFVATALRYHEYINWVYEQGTLSFTCWAVSFLEAASLYSRLMLSFSLIYLQILPIRCIHRL